MQSVTTRHRVSRRLTQVLLLCIFTVAFAMSTHAKNYSEANNEICQYSANENFAELQIRTVFTQNIMNFDALNASIAPCNVGPNVIGGVAFRDYNYDGSQGTLEPTQAGIEVYLYTCATDGNTVSTVLIAVTDENGEYAFMGLTDGQKYRVEFVIPEDLNYLGFSQAGVNNGTNVQFAETGTCDISVGVGSEAEYHQDNPFVATPCYINGAGDPGTEEGDALAFLAIEYDAEGANQNIELFTASEVGSLWGVSYNRATKTIFSAAVLRRHMGFGPGGTGAIYFMDVEDINNVSIEATLDLNLLGFPTGLDPRLTDTGSVPGEFGTPNHDANAWNEVARMSLGDIDISDDGKTLYVVNLFSNSLITIDLTDYVTNGTIPGIAQITSTPIPSFNCNVDGDWRPWALNHHEGDLYIGGICSAESTQDANDLTATIVKYDGTDFTEEYSFSLTYQRGDPFNTDNDTENERNQWFPWTNDVTVMLSGQFNEQLIYPQPILSDIEFDTDGSLILGFLDRTAQQGGYRNYGPIQGNEDLISTFSGGDLIRVCNIGGTYALEGSDAACTNAGAQLSEQGPNGQEYYWNDRYAFGTNPTGAQVIHAETALGALAILPGSGDIVATVFDPLQNVDAGGIAWFNNTEGNLDRSYEVFTADDGLGFPGKSNGLGDLELVCVQAPDEIGNYVWIDCNGDGIQDACEDPLEGMNVTLFDANGNMLASEITDAKGEYYFSEPAVTINPNSEYYIVFGTMGQYNSTDENTTVAGVNYQLTQANVGEDPNFDINDSDPEILGADAPAAIQGMQGIKHMTTCTGEVNHTYDAGFSLGVAMVDIAVTDASCPDAMDGTITITANPIENTETLEFNINGGAFQTSNVFTGLAAGTYVIVAQTINGGGAGGCGGSAMATVVLGAGENPEAPTTMDFEICVNEIIPAGMGLTAQCALCTDGTDAVVSFFANEMGGTALSTGSTFDPIASGDVMAGSTGAFTFFAQCACGPCESARTPVTLTVVESPMPTIVGDPFVCPGSQATFSVEPPNSLHTFEWEVIGGGLTIVGSSTATTLTVQAPDSPGAGPFTIKVTETGSAPSTCMGMATLDVSIKETVLACNDNVQVSLDANGCALITPDIILEGITGTGVGCYEVTITNQIGEIFGDKVTCENIGDVLTVNVASLCEENSCWSSIVLEDKLGPVFDCPGTLFVVDCTVDVDEIEAPTATDNCGTATVVLSEESTDASDACGGVTIVRDYVAIDETGNVSEFSCKQSILIQQTDAPLFPLDIIWQCDQYATNPSITDAAPVAAVVPDNDLTTPNTIDVPFWLPASTLTISGSGIVDAAEGVYCNYTVSHSDDTLNICTGLKIIRTWTLLNWCTNELILEDENGNDNIQIVKVSDTQKPIIAVVNFTMSANIAGDHPQTCATTGMIPLPELSDNCGAVSLTIYTEVGEAIYVNGVNANDGAFVPEPGLTVGFHTFHFIAEDDCGNITETNLDVEVVDDVNPTPVCDEVTDVVINSVGIATVQAVSFDDGSNDNCCIDRFEVKRLMAEDTAYTSEIIFDCTEVGDTIMLHVKVIDCYENSAFCTIEVRVEDKEMPICLVPNDTIISCLFLNENNIDVTNLADLEEQFGTATATDNCGAEIEELTSVSEFSSCGDGFLTRRFRATDTNGNVGEICEQNISILYQPDYQLTFPANFEGSCGELPTESAVIIESDGCDLIAVSHTDQLFNLSNDGACYKIIRRYEVINWCTYDENGTATVFNDTFSATEGEIVDETTFNNAGYLIYTQSLKIVDDVAPILSYTGETEFCVDNNCVTGPANLTIDIDENCTSDLDITWVLDVFNDADLTSEFDTLGIGQFNGIAPIGTHLLRYTVEDGCGNASSFNITFDVVDCKAPVSYCNGGIVVDLMDTNPPMVQIWASDLDAGSFDACGGEVTAAFSSNPLDTGLVFTCIELGTNTVEVYFIDEAGNFDYCATVVIVQQNLLATNGTPCVAPDDPVIAGTIATEAGEGLLGATVELNGNNNAAVTTDETGAFSFNAVAPNYDYSINSMQDTEHNNGVTTFDLSIIKSHILSINLLDSPYKMIAADANNSESVTTSDIVALRRLILTMDTVLPNNTSWRFVDANYEFPNPQNPWETGFSEVLNFNDFSTSQLNADFTAVKIGDVNGNAQANLSGNADERSSGETLHFGIENAAFKAGQNVTIDVTAQAYTDISSYQFTCDFDRKGLEFVGVKTTEFTTQSDFATVHTEAGYITVAHADARAKSIEDNTVIFSLEFKAKQAGKPSDFMEISSAKTTAIAYGTTEETMNVEFTFSSADEAFALYQNRPNPFTEATEIPFFLPNAGKVRLTIYDVSGKLMKKIESDYSAGHHEIAVNRNELGAGSIFYYQLDTENYSATRKMVLIK